MVVSNQLFLLLIETGSYSAAQADLELILSASVFQMLGLQVSDVCLVLRRELKLGRDGGSFDSESCLQRLAEWEEGVSSEGKSA